MATLELDPLFTKALRLLHSKAKDSSEQLRLLLDDVLAQKQNVAVISNTNKDSRSVFGPPKQEDNGSRLSFSRKSSPNYASENGNSSNKVLMQEDIKKEEKRKTEKIKQEPIEFSFESKRPKTESPQHSLPSSPSPQPIKLELAPPKIDDDSENSEGNADADNIAMEMGLACIVCKQIDIALGNSLVECQECHSLYHQECHRPPVSDQDINDPRHVWYCTRCTKNMKKMFPSQASKTQKSSKVSSNVAVKEPVTTFRSIKPEAPPPTLLPFKRVEPRVPASQSSGLASENKPIGLAGLAANLSGRTITAASSVTTKSGIASKSGNSGSSLLSGKSFSAFSALSSLASTRVTSNTTPSKATSSNAISGLSSLASIASAVSKAGNSTSTSQSKLGLGTLSSTTASTSNRINSSSGNNGNSSVGSVKSASSSSLMSADKRLQIMKKKAAAKMQEKRRLSSK
ncbi:integrator complex subunit 12-like isoform X1 [Centruroides sculpturatus]|uniref:integrator complex subunit 12-like isoform X1 n=1 Tax=Centruroides sculpturatus TaxID=218467 RepID=UPI000C6D65FC|nr:integrator complex subunit 12-like isoform X1 [Centruroides sculpturatus]XP_023223886.1 integrator complex subunit 12-like isoform X1 [Centruroides sculpturatus]